MPFSEPRYALGRKVEERASFTGCFENYGTKPGHAKRPVTLLLTQITDHTGTVVTDHLWFNRTKGFDALGKLRRGERLGFDARVKTYRKRGGVDYKLTRPTRIKRVIDSP
jgi:hypothetical protein